MCVSLKCANLEISKPKLLQGMATTPSLYSRQGRSFQIHQLVQYFVYCRSIQDICQLGSLWYLNIQSRKLSLFLITWKSLPSTLCHYLCVIVVLSNYITYNCVLVNCIMRNVFCLVGKGYVCVDSPSLSLTKRKTAPKLWSLTDVIYACSTSAMSGERGRVTKASVSWDLCFLFLFVIKISVIVKVHRYMNQEQ